MFDDYRTHGFGGEDFSRNSYTVLLQKSGLVSGVVPSEPKGVNLELIRHQEMMLCTKYQCSMSVCFREKAF